MSAQLPLGIKLDGGASFESFLAGTNAAAADAARRAAHEGGFVYLWGEPASGRSHLLQAACREAHAAGRRAAYLPLASLAPAALEGLEALDLVALDDLESIARDPAWERALFLAYEALRGARAGIVVASKVAPAGLPLALADLRSRLASGAVFQLRPLDDAHKQQALALRARLRGFELPEDTGQFLLTRYARDMHALCRLLDELDTASLAAQRRLTIPFVKSVLQAP
jgi:DnaA family protein